MITPILCLAFAASVPSQSVSGEELAPALLTSASLSSGLGLDAGQTIEIRRRLVRLNTDLLDPVSHGGSRQLKIELFDGEILTADLKERTLASGGFVWQGGILGEDHDSDVLLSVVGDSVTASIRSQDRLFRIAPAENGLVHYLAELDESAFPNCATSAAHEVFGEKYSNNGNGSRNPDVDVMVVYTKKARTSQGGTNAMNSLINLAVTETNGAYANVDVNQRIVLVHSYEIVSYTENGNFSTELGRLRAKNDGHFDEIHGLRDTYGADAVDMIINSSQYCGIAYLMTNPSHSFESNAFSVTSRSCATGYYSFGHELGHNFGCTHDHQNASNGSYNYSFGWRTSNNQYRTVMAYSPGTRIKYFSNHNKSKNGMPLGQANYAENWRSLNNTASIVAGWRDSGNTYDLDLSLTSSLVAGATASASITGSINANTIYLYNGSGLGSTTVPGLPVDLDIANGSVVHQDVANSFGFILINKYLPANFAGMTVYLQAADQDGRLSPVVVDDIL